jgi:hypothetical protein
MGMMTAVVEMTAVAAVGTTNRGFSVLSELFSWPGLVQKSKAKGAMTVWLGLRVG